MIYKLNANNAINLLKMPESGIGYQIINASLFNKYELNKFVVYNSNLIVDLDINFKSNKETIIREGYKAMLNKSPELLINNTSIKILDKKTLQESIKLSAVKTILYNRHQGDKGATDNVKENASGNETFVRVSAYEDDKRVDFINKRLVDGTYTTTLYDYLECVKTNDDPVDRYALPNDEKIKWAFYIIPKNNDVLQRGIVQPAFGHQGGGIEAFFEKGTSNETYKEKREYGK